MRAYTTGGDTIVSIFLITQLPPSLIIKRCLRVCSSVTDQTRETLLHCGSGGGLAGEYIICIYMYMYTVSFLRPWCHGFFYHERPFPCPIYLFSSCVFSLFFFFFFFRPVARCTPRRLNRSQFYLWISLTVATHRVHFEEWRWKTFTSRRHLSRGQRLIVDGN